VISFRRSLGTTAVVALSALLVTACGGGGNSSTTSASVGYGKSQPKVKITFWYMPNGAAPNDYFKAAYEWVRWLANQGQPTYVSKVGMWPSRGLSASAPVFASDKYFKAFKDQLQYGKSYPMVAAWGPIETALVKDFGSLWDQVSQTNGPVPRNTVKDDMTKAAQDVDAAIQQSK